ncbi:MATE family efflux transporter [Ligaoa zhengdingensis]|uniref:MATE family efflux transporter n=1 Tax=Ligaoa zhengdingensis TaxID=2763658 RepID=UPI0031BA23D2
MQKTENPMGYQSIWRLLASFSGPAIISTLVYSVYNIVDQIYIGQGVGYLGNAATTVTFPINTLTSSIAMLVSAGGSAYAAIRLGEKREEEAERTLSNMLLTALGIGLAFMAVCLLFIKPLLRLFGATDEIMPYAMDYAPIILIGTPAMMVANSLAYMARTDGAPKISMFGTILGAALNTILDPIYMFVFHWGVRGAAIATITSQYISAVVLLIYFIRKSKNPLHMRLKREYLKLDFRLTGSYAKLGISTCVTQGVGAVMQTIMNNSLRYYGALSPVGSEVAISAVGVVTKVAMVMSTFGIGIASGVQPIFGFNWGAGKYDRVYEAYKKAACSAVLAIFVMWVVCQSFPEAILSLFGDEDAAFTTFAVHALRTILLFTFLGGFQNVSVNYFQSTGQVMKATTLSLLRQLLILVPMLLILPLFLGLDGVLYATPVADACSTIVVACFMIPEMRRLKKMIQKNGSANQIQI